MPVTQTVVSNGVALAEQQADDGCVMTAFQADEASCTSDFDVTCPTGPDSTAREVFNLEYDPDGSHAEGTLTLTMTAPAGSCAGTYDVSFDRL